MGLSIFEFLSLLQKPEGKFWKDGELLREEYIDIPLVFPPLDLRCSERLDGCKTTFVFHQTGPF